MNTLYAVVPSLHFYTVKPYTCHDVYNKRPHQAIPRMQQFAQEPDVISTEQIQVQTYTSYQS